MIEIFPKDIDDERRVSILHREREDIEQIPNLGGGQIVKQVGTGQLVGTSLKGK